MKRMISILLLILAVAWAGAGCRPVGGQESLPPGTARPTGESVPATGPVGTGETNLDQNIHIICQQVPGITISNALGQSLAYDGVQFQGDIPIFSKQTILNFDAPVNMEIGYSDSLEVAYQGIDADFYMFTLGDYLVGVEGTGVSKIFCDFVERSGTVEGDHAKYTMIFGTGLEGYSRCFFTAKGPGFFQLTDDGIEVRALVSQMELRHSMKGDEIQELEVPQTEHFLLRPHDDGTAEIVVLEEP